MNSDERSPANGKLGAVADFVRMHWELANTHLVDFIAEGEWAKRVPDQIGEGRRALTDSQWYELLVSDYESREEEEGGEREGEGISPPPYSFEEATLNEFVLQSKRHSLPRLGLCTDVEVVLDRHGNREAEDRSTRSFDPIMSAKKIHEVETTANVIASIANKYGIQRIIDIGSGKGYLGSFLALHHNLHVIGIDSSVSNSKGAKKRNERLQKSWGSYERRAEARISGQPMSQENKHKCSNLDAAKEDANLKCMDKGSYVALTRVLTKTTNLSDLVKAAKYGESNDPDGSDASTAEEVFDENSCEPLMLVGLHTCGDLAASMIHIFLRHPQIRIMCNIGCCYHLIEEKYVANPYSKEVGFIHDLGFPLSKELNLREFGIGRNARMLACESLDRMVASQTNPSNNLFYRSLLQVLLKDHSSLTAKHVGRASHKLTNLKDYIQWSLQRLQLSELKITEEEIEQYFEKYKSCQQEIVYYHQLRSILAPVVEALVLADRLCYLKEQSVVKDAYLTRLFDPVTSPRCYALLAFKE